MKKLLLNLEKKLHFLELLQLSHSHSLYYFTLVSWIEIKKFSFTLFIFVLAWFSVKNYHTSVIQVIWSFCCTRFLNTTRYMHVMLRILALQFNIFRGYICIVTSHIKLPTVCNPLKLTLCTAVKAPVVLKFFHDP